MILGKYVHGRLYVQIHSQASHTSVPGPWRKTGPGQPTLPLPARIKSMGWVDKLLGQTPVYGLIFQSVLK